MKCSDCGKEYYSFKCSDCGVEGIEVHFERLTDEPVSLEQHGIGFIKCNECDEYFCDGCVQEHAMFEAFG